MKKVLIITYYFPPKPRVASLRFKGLAKYLPEFDWAPTFITPELPGPTDPEFNVIQIPQPSDVFKKIKKKLGLDPAKRIQDHMKIPASMSQGKKSLTNKLEIFIRGIVLFPNKKKGWPPVVLKAVDELMQKEKFDAVISSSPYPHTHLIANEIKKRYEIYWIADFRDLWTLAHFYKKGPLIKSFEKKLELKTLSNADAIVAVSKPWADKMKTLHNHKNVHAILNGFDPDDVHTAPLTKGFSITYTGKLHPGDQDPALLFKAVRSLIDQDQIDPEDIKINLFGPIRHWIQKEIEDYKLQNIVTHHGFVPREVSLQNQRQSQLLALFDWLDPKEQGVYTGKIFEYLASSRPVLAIGGGQGVIKNLLQDTNAGRHAENVNEVKNALLDYYHEYKTTGQISYNGIKEKIDKFSHREMSRQFAQILNSAKENK